MSTNKDRNTPDFGADVSSPSRRTFLRAGGLLAGTALFPGTLSACSSDDDGGGDSSPSPRGTGGQVGGTVRVWTVPASPEDEAFQTRKFDAFMADNPDVTVELQFFPQDQYGNAMQLAFSSGEDAPDVFRMAGGAQITLPNAYSRGWVRPIDEFLTDEFRGRFPAWLFDPSTSPLIIGGEAYAVPRPDPALNALRPLFYNIDVLEANGYGEPPATWSEYREMATKITVDGSGSVYGTATYNMSLAMVMQSLAGPQPYSDYHLPQISLLTGEPAMSEPTVVETLEFWQDLHRDSVLTPGWESWAGGPDIIQQMVQGRLAMYLAPIWHADELRLNGPDLNLGIAPTPIPDSGRAGSNPSRTGAAPFWSMSAEASNPEAAWRVLDFFGSLDFQQAAYQELGIDSLMPGVYEGVEVNEDTQRLRQISEDLVRLRPDPGIADLDALQFYEDLVAQGPTPAPGELMFDAVTNDKDFAAMAEQYDADLAPVMEQLLQGSDVSIDAFVYPDWDPLEDYAQG